jgi:hypothetical protein
VGGVGGVLAVAVVDEVVRAAARAEQVAKGCVVVSVAEKGSLLAAGSCGGTCIEGAVEVEVEAVVETGAGALAHGADTRRC